MRFVRFPHQSCGRLNGENGGKQVYGQKNEMWRPHGRRYHGEGEAQQSIKPSKKPQISLWQFGWRTQVEEEEEGFYWQKANKRVKMSHHLLCPALSSPALSAGEAETSLDAHVTAPALWLPENPADKTTQNGLENRPAVTAEWEFMPNAVSRAAATKLKSSPPLSLALKSSLCLRPALRSTILTWYPLPPLLGEGPVAHLVLRVFFFPSFSFASFPAV